MGGKRVAVLAVAMTLAMPASAQSIAAQQFGARESVRQISLSPDGKRYAVLAGLPGRGVGLLVGTLDGTNVVKPILRSTGDPEMLRHCAWSTADRLVCNLSLIEGSGDSLMMFTRMIAIDADGTDLVELTERGSFYALGEAQFGGAVLDWLPEENGAVLMERTFVPEQTQGIPRANEKDGLGVERIDTISRRRTTVERPRPNASGFITDGHGTVRVMIQEPASAGGYTGSRIVSYYRLPGDREWRELATATADSQTVTGFVPIAVDRDLNAAYGFDIDGGHSALFKIALDGSLKRELVFRRDNMDVDGLVRVGRQQRVVGVSFAADRRETAFFDPRLKALGASIGKAIPGLPLVSFIDASSDENKLLLFAGSDVDPGRYYVLDRATRHMGELLLARPELEKVTLAPVEPISFAAADGTQIPGYLTLPPGSNGKNLPAIVLPHGGPTSRDEWGFDWMAQFYAHRGFAVLQPNFRGSSGYGAAWFRQNGFRSWQIAVGDVNDGGRWLVSQGIAAPGKLAIVGWSYGGYAALQSPVLDAELFKAIVAVAPVTDLEMYRDEKRRFTSFSRVDAFVGTGPHVREGSPAQNVDRIKAPVLLFHGDRDFNVGVAESRTMASRLKAAGKRVEYVEFAGLDHQLDEGAARVRLLDQSERFLRAALGLPPAP